jgi:serine/threonine-protein kinase HipA
MTNLPASLCVWFGHSKVGHVFDTAPLSFEYAESWHEPMQIASIPLRAGVQANVNVTAFFENLLPEGDLRSALFAANKTSSLFGLLLAIAGDTVGGFVLLPAGVKPAAPRYVPTTWAALADGAPPATKGANPQPGQLTRWASHGIRISLAGAQRKFSVALFADDKPHLPQGTSPSTHIVKPDITRIDGVWASAVNEAIVMRCAALCGLGVAPVFYEPHTRACVVERFDRLVDDRGEVQRVMQYDLCQLSSRPSSKKYEAEGGPTLRECVDLVRKYSSVPALDIRRLLAWVFFNLYTGNNDSHAKNLSLYSPPGQGVRLTPFYDLMCTRIYPGLSPSFAFDMGGTVLPGRMTAQHVASMADQIGVRPQFAQVVAQEVASKLPSALEQATSSIRSNLPAGGATLAMRLSEHIEGLLRQISRRVLA